ETSLEDNFKKGWLPFDLVEEPEPFTPDDFNEIPKIEGPGICHTSNMDCLTKLKPNEMNVCAFVKTHGLLDFFYVCDIYLLNCLRNLLNGNNVMYNSPNENDLIYHNGLMHECRYYYKIAKNYEDSVTLYFGMDGYNKYGNEDIDQNALV
ncbi:hypothetical protein HW555_011418, partial [Spodoptera exigua]